MLSQWDYDAARAFYSGAVQQFQGFKDKYRNDVMQVRAVYDELDALRAINQVRDFMNALSAKIGEKTRQPIGNPLDSSPVERALIVDLGRNPQSGGRGRICERRNSHGGRPARLIAEGVTDVAHLSADYVEGHPLRIVIQPLGVMDDFMTPRRKDAGTHF
jgi:hypothetical protein